VAKIDQTSALVSLRSISKRFETSSGPVEALRPTSLSITAGESVGIYGPSGAGKSTLLNILGLAETPTTGELFFEDTLIDFHNEAALVTFRRYFLGFIFQYFNLIPSMTAVENVMLPLLLQEQSWGQAHATACTVLTDVGLSHRLQHKAYQLSGGEMQRVGIARALAHQPKLVLADEPTGNLDSKSGSAILDLLREVSNRGASFVMVSHSQDALKICSRLISLSDGVVSS
jgi:putative ABC transport system ATP-binding protein